MSLRQYLLATPSMVALNAAEYGAALLSVAMQRTATRIVSPGKESKHYRTNADALYLTAEAWERAQRRLVRAIGSHGDDVPGHLRRHATLELAAKVSAQEEML